MQISSTAAADIRQKIEHMVQHCQAYRGGQTGQALFQLATTGGAFLILCGLMMAGFHKGIYAVPLLLALPTAGLLIRLFIIQHDCGHGSFFPTKFANELTGRLISLFTLTPYDYWRRAHNIHHAGSGNLSRRGVGSIDTLTVSEYRALPWRKRLSYRLYRNPFLLLVLGPPLHVLILQRLPAGIPVSFFAEYRAVPFSQSCASVLPLDLALLVFYGVLGMTVGWKAMLAVYLPVIILTSWIGCWLFFIQHQFEEAYWSDGEEWNFHDAALLGSSHYDLPRWLHWFTGNIGLHHIHHLCSAIPNYRLQRCLDDSPELKTMNRLGLRESLKCIRWALWDEDRQKMVGFADLRPA